MGKIYFFPPCILPFQFTQPQVSDQLGLEGPCETVIHLVKGCRVSSFTHLFRHQQDHC